VLDNVTLYDRERFRSTARSNKAGRGEKAGSMADGSPLPLSSFRWNEVIFRSFQSGNLKQIDLEFYLGLRLPTTKRMYRFLDKRFYRRSRLDFDLRTFACEHIGLSRSYAPTELKRRLKPALEELEHLGFLEPLTPDERYSYVKRGCWRIIFIRGRHAADAVPELATLGQPQTLELLSALKTRGVTSKTAQELVEAYPAGRIVAKLEVFDWLLGNEDKRVGKNPAGYLVASIRSDYQVPTDYRPQTTEAGTGADAAKGLKPHPGSPEVAQRRIKTDLQVQHDKAREARLRALWEQLPQVDREAILAAVKAENPGLGRWQSMLEPLCLTVLETRINQTNGATGQQSLFPDVDRGN
jgi:hypothetical protein